MPLFAKPKAVLWPRAKSFDIYIDQKGTNSFSLDFNLWEIRSESELQSIAALFKQQGILSCSVLIPDDIVFTKSFIYDTKITEIDKKEVISLAESFVNFKIDESSINYKLIQDDNKTIIQATIFDKSKMEFLKLNLSKLGITINEIMPVSASIASVINTFFDKEYFLVYPITSTEYTLILSKGNSVYLTSNLKGPSLEVQKTINYSNLYFPGKITKFFVSQDSTADISSTAKLDLTKFSESQIAGELKKPVNFPLPVVGLILTPSPKKTDSKETLPLVNQKIVPEAEKPAIIKPTVNISTPIIQNNMENKKSILPIVAVFIVTALIVSVVIWFVADKNKEEQKELDKLDNTPTMSVTPTTIPPTATPIPIITEVSKKIKLQVLNATDINGQAATIKTKLTELGFTSVATGNNSEKLTENLVKIKPSLASASAYFKSKLDTDFPATYSTDLKESSSYDAVFIIGTELKSSGSTSSASVKTE